MSPRNFVAFAGFVMLIVGIYCPLISPLGLVKWNLFDLNKRFGFLLQAAAIGGILSSFNVFKGLNQKTKLLFAWTCLGLVLLIFIAVKVKVNTSFSFIPFPRLANTLSGLIHYRWGWFLLFAGPVLALLGSRKTKSIHTAGK